MKLAVTTDLDEVTKSITLQQQQIEANQIKRNQIYSQCMNNYLNHIRNQIQQFQASDPKVQKRNKAISSAYETSYHRIMCSAQVIMRKIKRTRFAKKEFWSELITNNVSQADQDLLRDFYFSKRDAQDKYEQTTQQQKIKRIPYEVLLGKIKKNQSLKQNQAQNRSLQAKVNNGTKTMYQWEKMMNKQPKTIYGQDLVMNQFKISKDYWAPIHSQSPMKNQSGFLKQFYYKK